MQRDVWAALPYFTFLCHTPNRLDACSIDDLLARVVDAWSARWCAHQCDRVDNRVWLMQIVDMQWPLVWAVCEGVFVWWLMYLYNASRGCRWGEGMSSREPPAGLLACCPAFGSCTLAGVAATPQGSHAEWP